MDSHSDSFNADESHVTQSVQFSICSSIPSKPQPESVPSQSPSTPESDTSSFEERLGAKNKKKKTKKRAAKKTKIQQKQQNQRQSNVKKFSLSPIQADFINKAIPNQYSLQNTDLKPKESSSKSKGKRLGTINNSDRGKYSIKDFYDGKLTLSQGYHFIESFVNEMLKDKEIPEFFKKSIDEMAKFEAAKRYYSDFMKLIPNQQLNLNLLLRMCREGRIKNFLEFKAQFDEMIIQSRYYHTLKGNLRMINGGEILKRRLQSKFCRELNPQGDTWEDEIIKTLDRKRPKGNEQKIENDPEKQIKLMDIHDEYNKYRLHVLNHYLKESCLKHQSKVEVIFGNLENIINKYKHSQVEITKFEEKKEGAVEQKKLVKKNPEVGTDSITKSPYSSHSEIREDTDPIYCQIEVKKMEVSLFSQLKTFTIREYQEKNSGFNFGEDMRDGPERAMYPREDSEDFGLEDDSDDF